MTVIGSASINIRADDKYFEPDVRRAVAKIKDLRVALKVDADMSAANKKLRDLRYRLSKQEVSIKIRANDVGFEADVRAAVRKIKNVSIDLKADVDSSKASKKIRDLRYRITNKPAILKVDADVSKAEEKMRKFLEKFVETTVNVTAKAHTGAAHTALSDLQTRYGRNVNFTATADTKVARAALAITARNRRAKITAFIDPTSMAAIKGAFSTLTGTLPFEKVKQGIAGVIASFEGLAIKSALVGTALLSVGAVALTAGANIFSIAGDITQVVGIAAMLPAAFIAMGAAIAANKMAWKGFGEALSSDPKKAAAAMAELPPQAQEAADSIRGLGKEIQKATQVSFWEALGTSLQDMINNLLPQLKEGFEYVGASLGAFEAATFSGISDAFGDGVLLGILTNVGDMLTNMSGGVDDFIQGLATLGRVGATYLPQLGTSMSEAGIKFGEFIRKADEAGKINQWIDTSVKRFQELGSIVLSTTAIMGGLTDIARATGAPGLTEMAAGFRNVADVVNSEPFQSQLMAILEGARTGTEALGAGLGTLTQLFWDSSESIGAFLQLAGEIGGLTFENITALFDGTGLGSGLFAALMGLKDGMKELKPGFQDIGTAIGDLGLIAGELFRSLAPGLNLLAETIKDVIGGMRDGIMDALPVLNEFVQAVMDFASGPLVFLAEAFGNMLTTFSELPGVVQTVIMSLGLFLLLKPKFANFFGGISKSLNDQKTPVGKAYADIKQNAIDTGAMMRQDMRNVGTSIRTVMSETGNVAKTAAGKVTGAFGNMATSLRNTMAPLGKAIGNSLMDDGGMERVKTGFNDMRYNAATNFAAVSMAASTNAQTMKGHFTDAAGKIGTKFADMGSAAKRGLGAVGGYAQSAAGAASTHINNMAKSIDGNLGKISPMATRAFNNLTLGAAAAGTLASGHISRMATSVDGHLGKISPMAQKAFNTMSLGAAAAGSMAGQHIGSMARTIDGHLGKISPSAQQAFRGFGTSALSASDTAGGYIGNMAHSIDGHLGKISPMAQRAFGSMGGAVSAAASTASGHINNMASSIDGHLGRISPSAQKAFNTMSLNAQAASILARDHISRIPETMGTTAARIGDSFSTATTRIGTAFDTISTRARDAAGRVNGALAPARKAFSDLATHAATAGTTAGRGFSSGVSSAMTGISDVLGGPWGIALMGATLLLGAFATAQQKTKQDVETLSGTLDKQTGAFTNMTKQKIGEQILQVDQGSISKGIDFLRGAGEDMDEILDKIGINLDDVSTHLTGPEADAYLKSWEEINIRAAGFAPISEELANSVGSTADAMNGMDSDELLKAGTRIVGAGEAAKKSQADFEALAEQMGTSTIQAQKLSANYDVLKNTASSVSEKVSALKSNLDILNEGTQSSADASKSYHQTLRDTATAIDEIKNRAGVSVPALYDVAKGFDFASQAGADLHTALGGQADAILTTAMTAFQAARDGGAEMQDAQETAMVAMSGPLESFKTSLAEMGFLPAQIDGIVASFGLVPDEVRTALYADGDPAVAEATRTKIMLDAIAEGNYEMVLSALPDEAKAALTQTMDLGDAFKNGEYETILKALDETAGGREAAILGLTTYAGTEWLTHLKALNLVPEEVQKANEAAQALMPEANLDIVAQDLASGILDNVEAYPLNGKVVEMTGTDLVSDILATINSSNLMDKDSKLTTEDLVSQSINELNAKHLGGKVSTLEAEDLASRVMEDVNALTMDGKVSTLTADDLASLVMLNLNGIELEDKEAEATVKDSTKPGIDSVNAGLAGVGGGGGGLARGISVPITVEDLAAYGTASAANTMATGVTDQHRGIFASNNTAVPTSEAQGTMGGLMDVFRGLFGINNTGAATGEAQGTMGTLTDVFRGLFGINQTGAATGEAQGTMNTLYDVVRGLQAFNQTAGATAESQATMETLQSVYRDLNAQNQTGGPLQASQATMNSLQSVMRDLQAQNLTGGAKGAAQGTMNSLQSVMRDLQAQNLTGGPVRDANGAIQSVEGTEVDIVANDYASGPAENAAAAIGRVVGRTVDVVTNFVSKHFNAEGGFYNGDGERVFANGGIMKSANNSAVQAFANGGISRGAQQQAVKAFAGGGTENHTAQIARGAWPVRIWAEPETGGEAYIPLSPNKRKRSLAILKEVMAEFGLEHLTHSFADGGLNKASRSTTPTVISSRYAAATTGSVTPTAQPTTQASAPVIHVHPSQGLNEEQIGVIASDRLWFNIQNSSF